MNFTIHLGIICKILHFLLEIGQIPPFCFGSTTRGATKSMATCFWHAALLRWNDRHNKDTLQGMDTYPTKREKENHLQNAIFGGYDVSSPEGTPMNINCWKIKFPFGKALGYVIFQGGCSHCSHWIVHIWIVSQLVRTIAVGDLLKRIVSKSLTSCSRGHFFQFAAPWLQLFWMNLIGFVLHDETTQQRR